jgi:hypothetical protein
MRRIHWPCALVWFGVPIAFWGFVVLMVVTR